MAKVQTKPGRWLYVIGALVIVAAIIASIASAVAPLLSGMKNVTVPGQTVLDLSKTGDYQMVYVYNTKNGSNTPITDYAAYSGMKFTLTPENGGASVAVTRMSDKQFTFTIAKAGKYQLVAAYSGKTGPSATLILMQMGASSTILISVIFYGGLVIGIGLIILTAVLRRKNRVRE